MIALIKFELYKILSKKVVIVGVLFVLAMNLTLYFNWAFPRSNSMSFKEDREYSEQFSGKLTDETIEKIQSNIISNPELLNMKGNSTITFFENNFAPENENDPLYSVDEVFGEGYDSDVKDSLVWGYSEGCSAIMSAIQSSLLILGFVILIGVSPIFAEEYTTGMDSLILTARYGKTKSIYSKIAASVIFSEMLTLISIFMITILFSINYGFTGWNTSVQLSSGGILSDVSYVLNFGEAYLIMCGVWILATAALAAFICIISVFSKSSFVSLLISFLIYIVPLICANMLVKLGLPIEVIIAAYLMSIRSYFTLVISQYMWAILLGIDLIICCVGIIISKLVFKNHQVR